MQKKDRAQKILDMIRKRSTLPPEQQGWIQPLVVTEIEPPEPLSDERFADFSSKFILERDGEHIHQTGWTSKELYERLVEVSDPDYVNPKGQTGKLRKLLTEMNALKEKELKQIDYLKNLDPFECYLEE